VKSRIYTSQRLQIRVYGALKKKQQNRLRKRSVIWFGHGICRLAQVRGGAYASNNALLALWLEVFGDDTYVAKRYILLLIDGWPREWYCR